jgi:hypothetical protein
VSCRWNPGSQVHRGKRDSATTRLGRTAEHQLYSYRFLPLSMIAYKARPSPHLHCRVGGHRSMAQCLSSRAPHAFSSLSATMPLSLDERLPRCGLLPVLRGHIVGGIPPAHRASQGLPQGPNGELCSCPQYLDFCISS